MNLCCSCKLDFGSVAAFDRHRVGRHAYTFLEGLRLDPPVEDGRRCLDEDEMRAKGFAQNLRGSWSLAAGLIQARAAFQVVPLSEQGHIDGGEGA